MIANERQYRITKAWLARFERDALTRERSSPTVGVHPRVEQAMRDALASEADVLREQLQRYEQLRDGAISGREIHSLRELPVILVEGRIAAHLTQRALAERLGVVAQQVQRWEATCYAGVGVDRLQDVADALGIEIHETVSYTRA